VAIEQVQQKVKSFGELQDSYPMLINKILGKDLIASPTRHHRGQPLLTSPIRKDALKLPLHLLGAPSQASPVTQSAKGVGGSKGSGMLLRSVLGSTALISSPTQGGYDNYSRHKGQNSLAQPEPAPNHGRALTQIEGDKMMTLKKRSNKKNVTLNVTESGAKHGVLKHAISARGLVTEQREPSSLAHIYKRTEKLLSGHKQKEEKWATEKRKMNDQICFLLEELMDAKAKSRKR
jgi:hypothetical protein